MTKQSWPVLPQAFLQKSLDSQKKFTRLKKITRFKTSALKLTVLLEIINLCRLSPKYLNTICKFVKIDHTEGWKVLDRKRSGFLQ